MNSLLLPLLAVSAGMAIAVQAALNAHLGVLLKQSLLASWVAFASSLLFISLAMLVMTKRLPNWETVQTVPWFMWFAGGVLSAFAIASFYWLIPKMGAGSMMMYALSGQLLVAMLISHLGWWGLPKMDFSWVKLSGIGCLLVGILLIEKG